MGLHLRELLLLHCMLAFLLLSPPPCSSFLLPVSELSRADFPQNFVFGAGTSAYQVEGAADKDGRTPSIWDTFTHAGISRNPGLMKDRSTGDAAADGYHHYKEDVNLMSEIGLEAYRFSISWSRLIPNGRGGVNPKGVEYYNNLINELINHGIEPHVTLFHFDLPQALEDAYGGWLSSQIIDDFVAYADICFKEFGDRVSYWTTINEPNAVSIRSYDFGVAPPNRCSYPFGKFNCSAGNSTTEPYIVMHNFLLAHARVVDLYKRNYQATQKGFIGIDVYAATFYPLTNSTADQAASERALDFMVGIVMNPLVNGDYPEIIKMRAGSRIPSFTESQSNLLKGSMDFIGVNYYVSEYVSDKVDSQEQSLRDLSGDMSVMFSVSRDAQPSDQLIVIGVPQDPYGLRNSLRAVKRKYGNIPIYIHENGFGTPSSVTLNDTERIHSISNSINGVLSALRDGSKIQGYFVWSFLDGFEFITGFSTVYGLYYVDLKDENRRREMKLSAAWYKMFLNHSKEIMAY